VKPETAMTVATLPVEAETAAMAATETTVVAQVQAVRAAAAAGHHRPAAA